MTFPSTSINALVGFSRLTPAMNKDDNGFVDAKEAETNWYPAYEVRGEGIFIEFNQADIDITIELKNVMPRKRY